MTIRQAGRAWLLGGIALALAIGNGAASAAPATADNPADRYWFLKAASEREQGVIDPAVQQVSDAYGKGEFARCRELAEGLLEWTKDERIRTEAMAYVVEAWIAEGNLAKAAQVAAGYPDAGLAARVASRQQAHAAALARLAQSRTDGEEGPAAAALREARVNRQAGLLEPAQTSYWRVITEYPDSQETVRAVRELINMHQVYGTQESVAKVCGMVVGFDPDGKAAAAACEAVSGPWAAWSGVGPAPALAVLRAVENRYPGTRAGALATLRLGGLLVVSAQYEEADEAWTRLLDQKTDLEILKEARYRRAELRYERGLAASAKSDYQSVAIWLGRLLPDIQLVAGRSAAAPLPPTRHPETEPEQRRAVFLLGEAYEHLGRWQEAADTYGRLAVTGNPAEEVALFKLFSCHMEMRDQIAARHYRDALASRYPQGEYARQAVSLFRD